MHNKNNNIEDGDSAKSQNVFSWRQCFCAVTIALGWFNMGYLVTYPSGAMPSMYKKGDVPVTRDDAAMMATLTHASMLVGSLLFFLLSRNFGRRITLLFSCAPMSVGWIVMSLARNLWTVYAGIIICGLGSGLQAGGPAYAAELSHPKYRGLFVGLSPLAIAAGHLFGYLIGGFTNWRGLAASCTVIPILKFCSLFWVPESPKWLLWKNQVKKAEKSLQWLRGSWYNVSSELEEIKENLETNTSSDGIMRRKYLRPIVIVILLHVILRGSGIRSIFAFSYHIFEEAGLSDPWLSSVYLGIIAVVSNLILNCVTDKIGRRCALMTSCCICGLALAVLGLYFYLAVLTQYKWLPLVCVLVFVFGFTSGLGPIPYILQTEILPQRVRDLGCSLGLIFNMLTSIIATVTMFPIIDSFGAHVCFWIYGVICFSGVVLTVFCIPETKGRTLESIERNK